MLLKLRLLSLVCESTYPLIEVICEQIWKERASRSSSVLVVRNLNPALLLLVPLVCDGQTQ
jgi:hypothetical protein